MAINKVNYFGQTLIDLSGDTLTSADQLLKDIVAHDKAGNIITGTLEAGGGVTGIATGVYIPATTSNSNVITHGLGVVPKLFVVCCGERILSGSKILQSAYGFSDRNLRCRMSRVDAGSTPSGYIDVNKNITDAYTQNNVAINNATATTINVGAYKYNLYAGVEYYWFALA